MLNLKTGKIAFISSLLFTTVTLIGCQEKQKVESEESLNGNEIDLSNIISGLMLPKDTSGIIHKSVPDTVIPTTRAELENMKSVVQVFNGKDNAGIAVPGFGNIKLGKDQSNTNAYYIEYKTVKQGKDTLVYGIGYSVHYLFEKVKRGLSVNNISSIAASAELESSRTKVRYSIQSYGIIGVNLVKYFKPVINENFDVKGFAVIQTATNGIHNILGDTLLQKAVKFTPQHLKYIKPGELEN